MQAKIPVYVGCACVGDTVGAVWLTPSEIIKQRLQSVCNFKHMLVRNQPRVRDKE